MKPFFTIITPTVQRESLVKCCDSINSQSFTDWEHVVAVDSEIIDISLMERCSLPLNKRTWISMGKCYRNGGNTPRHVAWRFAQGHWVYHLDCDNYLYSPTALEEISSAIEGIEEKWGLFPIHRHGSRFFFDPPQPCYFDTGNAVVRREIAQWPNIDDYCSDAVWLVDTLLKHPYKAFPDAKPIMVMPGTSYGAGGGINGQ